MLTGDELHVQSFAFQNQNVKSSEIQFLFISIYLNAMQRHHLKQVHCLALAVIVFCMTIVACNVSVSFLNAYYVGFGLVFFCMYEEYKALINLSGFPQGHPQFDILATPCGLHVAHCHSTHAKAFTLLKFYRYTRIQAFTLLQSCRRTHPSSSIALIHHRAHSIARAQARANVPVCVWTLICSCSLVYTR